MSGDAIFELLAPGDRRISTEARTTAQDVESVYIEALDARTLVDLLRDISIVDALTNGLVFVQDRRVSGERLLDAMERRVRANRVHTRRVSIVAADLEDLRRRLSSRGRRIQSRVTVLEATGDTGRLANLLDSVTDDFPRRNGLWIRAHVRDLTPRALQRFDIVFMFDMAMDELEAARTAIPFSDRHLAALRRRNDQDTRLGDDPVLVFLALDAEKFTTAPLLARNPVVISLRDQEKELRMPIDAFVPVIVEAVKFFFGRWGKKLDEAHGEMETYDAPTLAISADSLEEFTKRPDEFLIRTINDETAALLEEQLRSLMRRIRDRQKLIDVRAEKAVLAGDDMQAKLELMNERDEATQGRDWSQLTSLLNRVIVPVAPQNSIE